MFSKRFPWARRKTPARIRATRDQTERIAAEAEEKGKDATKRFRYSTLVFITGLVPLSVLGVYGAITNVHGSVLNTLVFIALSFIVSAAFMVYLTRDLDERLEGMLKTIAKKGFRK
ncbi:MAG: hypothetical protein ABH834_03165 [Candidatus Altiarchaeota archaeon]